MLSLPRAVRVRGALAARDDGVCRVVSRSLAVGAVADALPCAQENKHTCVVMLLRHNRRRREKGGGGEAPDTAGGTDGAGAASAGTGGAGATADASATSSGADSFPLPGDGWFGASLATAAADTPPRWAPQRALPPLPLPLQPPPPLAPPLLASGFGGIFDGPPMTDVEMDSFLFNECDALALARFTA
jgi:hypothetical protein